MFEKILIANRGEIACRVIKTARRLGIKTVAVFSDADKNSLHVQLADEAVHIGEPEAANSYLRADKIIDAARLTGAQAIHPGYGFLSENAAFSDLCAQENIVFIGPPKGAIEAMGSKSAAKQIMEQANVPLVPGYHGDNQDSDLLEQQALDMGYPVLLKAVAGGGGKGMRQVWAPEEFKDALAAAKREAKSSFGNDDMLVEKYLTQPRHVEVQVFCDSHGNGVYLFERDCSVQRRHQKVIEEAPAPGLTDEQRQTMGETALRAAKAINYVGAGTVEFLFDSDGSFYFMEMNTRLQVEHPITEMITGQDLVEWQLRVAAGEPLPLEQEALSINGHAFEARIYAEDPDNDFLPVTGNLAYVSTPSESEHVRIDTGVMQGDDVSIYYDPMIAKLIVWDENRDRALSRLGKAISEYRIAGLTTNIPFLYNLATSQPFKAAELDTGFIGKHADLLFHTSGTDAVEQWALPSLLLLCKRAAGEQSNARSPWAKNNSWRLNGESQYSLNLMVNGHEVNVVVADHSSNQHLRYTLSVGTDLAEVSGHLEGDALFVDLNGHRRRVNYADLGDHYLLYADNQAIDFHELKPDTGDDEGDVHGGFKAPMNGKVVAVMVEAGAQVEKDQTLVIMEAMKMEHSLRAPSAGVVTGIFYNEGDLVSGGDELLSFDAEAQS